MRNFNEADRKKKQARIQKEENPGNLSQELLAVLDSRVKVSLKDGYLSCPMAWKIAKEFSVPKIAVGNIADKLGIRVTDCQIGCFKVDKTVTSKPMPKDVDDKVIALLEVISKNNELTCAKVFELAKQAKLTPMAIADIANHRKWKIRDCQLGCF